MQVASDAEPARWGKQQSRYLLISINNQAHWGASERKWISCTLTMKRPHSAAISPASHLCFSLAYPFAYVVVYAFFVWVCLCAGVRLLFAVSQYVCESIWEINRCFVMQWAVYTEFKLPTTLSNFAISPKSLACFYQTHFVSWVWPCYIEKTNLISEIINVK